jgi:hypothetical protein
VSFDLKKLFGVPNAAERIAGLQLRPDLAIAALKMARDERSDPEVKMLEQLLTESESVVIVVEGSHQRKLGFLALTTERVLFRPHGAIPGNAEIVPLGDVSGAADRARGMSGRVSVQAVCGTLDVDKILGIQAAQFAQALRRQLDEPGPLPVPDPLEELASLRDRRAAGMISERDFKAAKARLLDEL